MNIKFYFLIIYFILINIVSVVLTIYDKYCAIKNHWRVKELTLLFFAAIGGSIGMYITMQIIRHKTRHIKFMLGIPVILIIQVIFIFCIWGVLNV